jgi:hypothetical protein
MQTGASHRNVGSRRATLELADPAHAAFIDEVEVGGACTPSTSLNARLEDPAGLQLTLFEELA